MKKLKLISILLFAIFVFACKKDNSNNYVQNETIFYKNPPNIDGLLSEVKLSKENATVFFYGSSDTEGYPRDINSASYVHISNDTITNVILDSLKRVRTVTFNKKNGQKINTVLKFDYIENDTIVYNAYQYNWETQSDSLLVQIKVKDTFAIQTYGKRTTPDDLFNTTAITMVNTLAGAALVCVAIATSPWWVPALIPVILANPGTAIGVIILAAAAVSNASEQQYTTTTNPNAPTSPTAENATIPNPVGTPSNPSNNLYHWYGTMIMTSDIMIEDCEDVNNNGISDDCGTGGCQSGHRALFGSPWGTGCPIEFAYSSVMNQNNFKMILTKGGYSTYREVTCYTANITPNENFVVGINNYAPNRWGGSGSCGGFMCSYLNDITFTIVSQTATNITGTWTGLVRVVDTHCLEQCSGTWQVSKVNNTTYSQCDYNPYEM